MVLVPLIDTLQEEREGDIPSFVASDTLASLLILYTYILNMGQISSSLGLEPAAACSSSSPFTNLPADVLLLISDHLDTPSALSLSLTSRGAHAFLLHALLRTRTVSPQDKHDLLLLLERDPANSSLFYCPPCRALHSFSRAPGHGSGLALPSKCPATQDRFSPVGNTAWDMTYARARLALNAHLYGAARGIPLSALCAEHTCVRDAVSVHCTTAARVLDDELFLHRRYTLTVRAADVARFRRSTGPRDFRLCEHTSFFANSSPHRQYVPELHRRPWTGGDGLVPCENAPGSCGVCLMDYDVSITPSADASSWAVVIRAYHQLGDCRTPDDWKWARFTESSAPQSVGFPDRPNRRGSYYYPGMVRRTWLDDDFAQQDRPMASEETAVSTRLPAWCWRYVLTPLLAMGYGKVILKD
ncbi:hypothetical protein B0I35DRAFT_416357 [Stachybotrys elegans]|uniref:F-box domain-containing protein n=1 Tax=Stachybotrys elegans TaxID=80388 RepID=A0A8K0T609_9HYPO|nr:hypothetical protein B0I35DRAFT_416357 [Stachybotrys elegans]